MLAGRCQRRFSRNESASKAKDLYIDIKVTNCLLLEPLDQNTVEQRHERLDRFKGRLGSLLPILVSMENQLQRYTITIEIQNN